MLNVLTNAINREAEADKKADAARKKAEREALLAEEEKDQPIKPKGAGAKKAEKKTLQAPSKGTLDLSALDDDDSTSNKPSTALNATGIDNALDALSLTNHDNSAKVDRHPERRFKAAYAAFEARRLPEVEVERPGLRKNQRVEIVRKEFERSDENPFNQVNAKFDSTRDEVREIREKERGKVEGRLGGS